MIDSIVVHTHACAAGAPQSQLEQPQNQALRRSASGLSTKIHIMVDGLGNPLNFTLTAGQTTDVTQASTLIERTQATYAGQSL